MRSLPGAATLVLAALLLQGGCAHATAAREISRERALQIARREISFEPDRIDARRVAAESGPVWRVVFRGRLPGQPPLLFETYVVDVSRRTGAVMIVARN